MLPRLSSSELLFYAHVVRFCCVEQYMHAAKALIFKDFAMFANIMLTSQPAEAKALGRQVGGAATRRRNVVRPVSRIRIRQVYFSFLFKFVLLI